MPYKSLFPYLKRNGYVFKDNYGCECKWFWVKHYDNGIKVQVNRRTNRSKEFTSSQFLIYPAKAGKKPIKRSFYKITEKQFIDYLLEYNVIDAD